MRGRQISKKDRDRIESMSKAKLGSYIMKTNPNSGAFRYAIKTFVKKRK